MIWSSGEQAEVDRHDLDDGAHAAQGRTDARADEPGFGERRVADPFRAEFIEQPFAHRKAPAVPAHILSHEENPFVFLQGLPDGLAHGLTVGELPQVHIADGHGILRSE